MSLKTMIAAVAFAAVAGTAQAGTISITSFAKSDYNAALAAGGKVVTEDFEGFTEGNVANGFSTAVGTFSTLGGTGTGGTVTRADFINNGSQLAIRDGNVFGRVSTTKLLSGVNSDNKFLDSNDTYGISWVASLGGSMFNRLLLTLTDAADVGASLLVTAGGDTQTLVTAGNGNKQTVVINLGAGVTTATVTFENRKGNGSLTNDGFSLDDIAVSAVPLPAGVLLMGTAFGGLAFMRRRKTA